MTLQEETRQQLDPAVTAGARGSTIVLSVLSLFWAIGMSIIAGDHAGSPVLLGIAIALLGVACGIVIYSSDALRAPFSYRSHVLVHVVVLVAFAVATWSTWGDNPWLMDDWAPISLGLLTVAMSPYRPARELAALGTLSAVFISFITLLKVDGAMTTAPTLAFVVAAVLPFLALSYGSARYSQLIIDALIRWRLRADVASAALADELRDGITRSVQQDRVTILGRDVAPFFSDVIERGEITDDDRDRARDIAAAIRSVMVADADRSWLQAAVDGVAGAGRAPLAVEDSSQLAHLIRDRQRTALRALMVALSEDAAAECVTVRLSETKGGTTATQKVGVLTATMRSTETTLRASYDPYLAVLRIVFPSLTVEFDPPTLIARFSFDHT